MYCFSEINGKNSTLVAATSFASGFQSTVRQPRPLQGIDNDTRVRLAHDRGRQKQSSLDGTFIILLPVNGSFSGSGFGLVGR